jgi:CelD/BcsL family acetyltransferase involved in cellulose biosynthesis
MRVTLHKFAELTGNQIELWNSLLLYATACPSPFLSYGFCRVVNQVRGGVRVLQFQGNDGKAGFLPFQLRNGRTLFGHAEKVGGAMSDYFGVIGNVSAPLKPDRLLHAARLSSLRFDHAVAEMCPFDFDEREKMSGVRVHVDSYSRYLEVLQRGDRDFLKTVTRSERRLVSEVGEVSFDWQSTCPLEELERLIAVKREQYRRTGVADVFAASWRRSVLQQLVRQTEDTNCRPILSTLYSGGKWIAANLSLGCGSVLHIWFPAYDPGFRRFGPGHILFLKLIECGVLHGFRTFDFGQGQADYKKKYQGQSYTLWKGALTQNSFAGLSERALQSLEWRLRKINSVFAGCD